MNKEKIKKQCAEIVRDGQFYRRTPEDTAERIIEKTVKGIKMDIAELDREGIYVSPAVYEVLEKWV